ncbi:hypothetical protein [Bacillus thuringiensis]|uniref:hypothetical protein n=1 Tax=Bacillus thuringiensis TaxID=1428 RepID=UPI000BFD0ED0|nr:hypothetical protein [Bacillus thuringiensis]PGT90127.1 hypothetical protein COD17_10280 [Bacillus thuringiensis]
MSENKYCGNCGSEKVVFRYGASEWYGSCEVCGYDKGDVTEAEAKEYVERLNDIRTFFESNKSMKRLEAQGISVGKLKRIIGILNEESDDFYCSDSALKCSLEDTDYHWQGVVNEVYIDGEWLPFTERISHGKKPLSKHEDLRYVGKGVRTRMFTDEEWLAKQKENKERIQGE